MTGWVSVQNSFQIVLIPNTLLEIFNTSSSPRTTTPTLAMQSRVSYYGFRYTAYLVGIWSFPLAPKHWNQEPRVQLMQARTRA